MKTTNCFGHYSLISSTPLFPIFAHFLPLLHSLSLFIMIYLFLVLDFSVSFPKATFPVHYSSSSNLRFTFCTSLTFICIFTHLLLYNLFCWHFFDSIFCRLSFKVGFFWRFILLIHFYFLWVFINSQGLAHIFNWSSSPSQRIPRTQWFQSLFDYFLILVDLCSLQCQKQMCFSNRWNTLSLLSLCWLWFRCSQKWEIFHPFLLVSYSFWVWNFYCNY